MKNYYELAPFNFGELYQQDFNKAKVVVVPVPYEATVCLGTGTSAGPEAIISSSRYLDEMWDMDDSGKALDLNVVDVFTLQGVRVSKNSVKEGLFGIDQVMTKEVLNYDKLPLMLGGEHSITYGAIKALKKKHQRFSVLHLDAHTDLLNFYEGTKYSHASVMRRVSELGLKITQVGIRNMNTEVKRFLKRKPGIKVFQAPELPVSKIIDTLSDKVYLSFDLDAFDPSIMPAVGTPEPGGLLWWPVIDLIRRLGQEKTIIGADIVELCPIPGLEAPNFLAAKLAYHIILAMLKNGPRAISKKT